MTKKTSKPNDQQDERVHVSLDQPVVEYEEGSKAFFENVAADYHKSMYNPFWKLSQSLIFHLMDDYIVLPNLGKGKQYLDAGGGTGRLTWHILETDKTAKVTLFDFSPDMLAQAENIGRELGLLDRVKLVEGNLMDMKGIKTHAFDAAVSANNVFGFVYDSSLAMEEISRTTKLGSMIGLFGIPNAYHGAFFNQTIGRYDESRKILETLRGTYTPEMPEINFFTPDGLFNLYLSSGIRPYLVTGMPVTIYPGYADTDPRFVSDKAQTIADPQVWNNVFELERGLLDSTARIDGVYQVQAARGNGLAAIGKREILVPY
ncbi:MAG: class I SAM-dependent methyltransferase [Candidatus Woesearchaeota archaeon]|nr:class I SAM-dependent methyltransferase [Candidatus Woesearchaeota archaeon]